MQIDKYNANWPKGLALISKDDKDQIGSIAFKDNRDATKGIIIELSSNLVQQLKELLCK